MIIKAAMPGVRRTSRLDRNLIPENPDLSFEQSLWQSGISYIAGIDEAGRGALAGPVAAAAVIFPRLPNLMETLSGVRDSKQMSAAQRQLWAERICDQALAYAIGMASAGEIDELGIVSATRLAIQRALGALNLLPEHLLLDYLLLPETPLAQTALIKGDCRSLSIAAASILAKTSRDAQMVALDSNYSGYGLARHKGYGTLQHRQAIKRKGLSPLHRHSFVIK